MITGGQEHAPIWSVQDYLIPLNETVQSVDLHLDVRTSSSTWWQMQLAMSHMISQQKSLGLTAVRFCTLCCHFSLRSMQGPSRQEAEVHNFSSAFLRCTGVGPDEWDACTYFSWSRLVALLMPAIASAPRALLDVSKAT
jgi:hypothetical protein